jgi:alpha-amylase/alpha-mannosidase (GH57 family)
MLHVALLWHMHQPYYVNPLNKTALMPWVRLHAVKGYLDMVEMARRHPEMKMVFNLTPVLVKQILELVNGEVKDLWEEWSKIPADQLTNADKRNLLEHFFKANWDNLIRPNPRYHELLSRRGYDLTHISLNSIVPSFSKQDYLDLQVWFNLAWCGYAANKEFPELGELKKKGKNFTEEDKLLVLGVHRKILRSLLGRYKELAAKGAIEISTTPFFHPISPLLINTDFTHRAMPMAAIPRQFSWPEDIEAHMVLAMKQHETVFGVPPAGLWPSEGSVCPELLPIWHKLGLRWFATDEDILFRSLARESGSWIERSVLYDPYEAEYGGATVKAVFRDRSLSDFIGFSAAKNSPADASTFIMRHIQGIASATHGRRDPLVGIILDGENAWEYFSDGGEGFLDQWYRELTRSQSWRMVTLAEHSSWDIPRKRIHQLHTGSWIQGNFDIWIGDAEENRAWDLLGETRKWWEEHKTSVPPETAEQVWMEIYAAEGSDWFWWYGPDFQTDNDLLFDELFRLHLQNVYTLCGAIPPESLHHPICRPTDLSASIQTPIGIIQAIVDGIETTFFEWHEAGRYTPTQSHGAMFQGERIIKKIHFGFDMSNFFLRLDPYPEVSKHSHLQIELKIEGHELFQFLWSPATGTIQPHSPSARENSNCAFKKIVELSVPFSALKVKEADLCKFQLRILQNGAGANPVEMERHPHFSWFEFQVPNEHFAAALWSA